MEGALIQAMWHIGPIRPLGLLVVIVLCALALKFSVFRMLLGGLVALWVAVVGVQALWHTAHFYRHEPPTIISSPPWPVPPAPTAPAPPRVAIIHHGEPASLRTVVHKVIKIDEEAVEAEISQSAETASDSSATVEEEADAAVDEPALDADQARPEWLATPPKRIGNVEKTVVSAGPWKTFEECAADLDVVVMKAVAGYMRDTLRTGALSESDLRGMGITESYVRQNICTDQYVETSMHDFAGIDEEMYTVHVLMQFDPSARRFLEDAWQAHQRQISLGRVSLAGGGVLGLLSLVYGLLKVDTWTKGYYSKRLFLGVPAAVLVMGLILLALKAM